MTALAIVTLIIITACLWWIEAEQAEYERKHYVKGEEVRRG